MANKIKPKRSYTANSVPTTSDLDTNELAIRWTAENPAMFTKNASGNIVSVTLGSGGGLTWSAVPASATATGTAGQIAYDAEFLYTCVTTNTWRRTALSTWVTFTPASITGLQLWLDASDAGTLFDATSGGSLVAADGAVARWQDKSGNNRHATQETSASRPLRKTAVQGGKDALRFDGSDDTLSLPSITIPASHTVFSVFGRATASIHSITLGSEVEAGVTRYSAWWFNDNVVYIKTNDDFSTHGSASTSTGAFLLVNIRTATTSVVTRRNGAQLASVTSGSAVTNASSGTWTHVGSVGTTVHSGNLCEIIVYNTALSDTDRAAVESYLMSKWGIT